jgi:alcohol dehydrogenase (cytochrome c)
MNRISSAARILAVIGGCIIAIQLAACRSGDAAGGSSATDSMAHRGTSLGTNVGWSLYNGGVGGRRFSDLDQITRANVAGLRPLCRLNLGEDGSLETGPIVFGDTMVVTTPHSTVALDATNCSVIWRNVDRATGADVQTVNRGAAYLNGQIFRGTPDGRLVAINSRSGQTVWNDQVGNPAVGEFISSAPIAWKGTVFVGVAGGDWGIRGHVMAFDAATGVEKWRFYTIASGKEPGSDSWKIAATSLHGGGAQWTSYALDTLANELFVPTGNPAPAYAPQQRPGDNLYTNSLVVLNATTGALKWYYQVTPHDSHGWDLSAAPVLYHVGDTARVALGSKDGHVYSVARSTHTVIFRTPVTTISDSSPASATTTCPGPLGGVGWNGPAYDPQTKLLYAGSIDWCGRYPGAGRRVRYRAGHRYTDSTAASVTGTATGWVTALDAGDGTVKWKFRTPAPVVAGITPTAGGVVFTGDVAGNLYAFDAASGRLLFRYVAPGSIAGGVITYAVGGKQYVALTSGSSDQSAFHTAGSPTIVIMALGVTGVSHDTALAPIPPRASTGTDSARPATNGHR